MINEAMEFILECEKLKAVERVSCPVGMERRENSAEHSWSLALSAMTLIPVVDPTLDTLRVLKMLLIHDLVEIDAGDTFCYADQTGKEERETKAAERLFGLLSPSSQDTFMPLWREFEDAVTKEALFANALDRLFPLIQNTRNGGGGWVEHGITYEQVYERNYRIKAGSEELWEYALKLMDEAFEKGWLPKADQ